MTLTLTDFLLARIADDERWAQMAGHGYGHRPLGEPRNAGWVDIDMEENCRPSYDAEFVRQWSPDRVEIECKAKREIIDSLAGEEWFMATLALPYADHPDYREEWKP